MATTKYLIGVDVGATKIAAGLVFGKKVIKIIKIPTQTNKGKKTILNNIIAAIKKIYHPKVLKIGIGITGQIDQKKGMVISSPNLPKNFKNVRLAEIIQKKFKKPVKIENDVNCFTLAESIWGAGKKYNYVIGVTLGTGVGGGIVINKKIYLGRNGWAGEFGHMTIVANGLKCSCGQRGHLEAYTAGPAMIKLYKKLTGKTLDTLAIEEKYKLGEKAAKQTFKQISGYLALGLVNLINTLNPDIIVLGGGLAKVSFYVKPAISSAKVLVFSSKLKSTKIVQSQLKEKAAILGATLIS